MEKTSFECSKHHLAAAAAAAVLHLGPPLKYVTSTSSSLSSALPLVNHLQISNLRHGNLSSSRLSWTDGILNLLQGIQFVDMKSRVPSHFTILKGFPVLEVILFKDTKQLLDGRKSVLFQLKGLFNYIKWFLL